MVTIEFDTSVDDGRVEEGTEIEPRHGSVLSLSQGDVRPTFHLMDDGSVTIEGKTGVVVPNFGHNGRVVVD